MITNYHITVNFGCTQNVGEYSNVRPEVEVSLSGSGDGQEARAVLERLLTDVRTEVHQIVDDELELHGQHVLYDTGDTYSLVEAKDFHFVAIVSDRQPLPPLWESHLKYGLRNKRMENLRRVLALKYRHDTAFENVPVVDVADLPVLERFTTLTLAIDDDHRYLLLLPGDRRSFNSGDNAGYQPIPHIYYTRAIRQQGILSIMDRDRYLRDMLNRANSEHYDIVDCLDGDFTRLPDLPPIPEKEEEEEDYDEDDYEANE